MSVACCVPRAILRRVGNLLEDFAHGETLWHLMRVHRAVDQAPLLAAGTRCLLRCARPRVATTCKVELASCPAWLPREIIDYFVSAELSILLAVLLINFKRTNRLAI